MKKPRDIEKYVSRDDAFVFLLGLADRIAHSPVDDRYKINVEYSRWNDEWADKTKRPPVVVEKVTASTG